MGMRTPGLPCELLRPHLHMPHDPHPRIGGQHPLDTLGPSFRPMTGFADHPPAVGITIAGTIRFATPFAL